MKKKNKNLRVKLWRQLYVKAKKEGHKFLYNAEEMRMLNQINKREL